MNDQSISPNPSIESLSFDVKTEFESLRKDLIDTFYSHARSRSELIIKRKLGIFTSDVCHYYRGEEKSERIVDDTFQQIPTIHYDLEQDQLNPLGTFQHLCMSCPLNLSSLNNSDSKISTWSHIFVCDICHCSRTLEENMIRHLKTELHLSATEYLTDTVAMTLHHCVRRSSLKLQIDEQQKSDSIIVCPICNELFSSVNCCALHSFLVHQLAYVYSIVNLAQSDDILIKRDHQCPDCNEQYKKLSFLVQHFDDTGHGPQNGNEWISLFVCPITNCHYRTKRFFSFKNHLMLMHSDAFHPIDATIQVKIQNFHKPQTFMHITKYSQQNSIEIQAEIKTLEELEIEMKQSSNNGSLLKLIRIRIDILKSLTR